MPKHPGLDALDSTKPLQNVDVDVLIHALETSRSPLILTDNRLPDNPIVYSNQAFLDLTGYDLTDIIGKNCRFLQGEDSEDVAVHKLRQAVKTGGSTRVSLKNYRKDGEAFWNDLLISPITDDKGVVTHFLGMQLDITDRVLAEQRLEAKKEELERSNHELEQFTYATSHDLQEPLRMVSSYLQLIEKRYGDGLDDSAKEFLGFAKEGADRMQDLISDLLTLSRVGSAEEMHKAIDMKEVVDRALFNLRLSIEQSGAQITIAKLPKLKVDAVQMTQLFQNLVGNAIKYHGDTTPKVDISVSCEKVSGPTIDGNNSEYVFSVTDNGIGIEKKHFKRIFAVFQRLHTRSEYPGTGIGLAICAKIVERHGGRIWVESIIGKGSSFKFSIPVRTAHITHNNSPAVVPRQNARQAKGTQHV